MLCPYPFLSPRSNKFQEGTSFFAGMGLRFPVESSLYVYRGRNLTGLVKRLKGPSRTSIDLSAVSLLERKPHSEPLPQGARRAARGSITAELNGRGEQDEASSKGHSFVELTKAKEEIQVID